MADFYVHPKGINESDAVGEGTRIWAFAHVMKGAIVGRHCNIGETSFVESGAILGNHVTVKNGVSIWDGVTIEDNVFLGPHSVLTNDPLPRSLPEHAESWSPTPILIREGATVGANATIVCGNTLGPWCFVGAGAVVMQDVPAHALVVGNLARWIGWACRCGARLSEDLACPDCSRKFRKEGDGLVPLV